MFAKHRTTGCASLALQDSVLRLVSEALLNCSDNAAATKLGDYPRTTQDGCKSLISEEISSYNLLTFNLSKYLIFFSFC